MHFRVVGHENHDRRSQEIHLTRQVNEKQRTYTLLLYQKLARSYSIDATSCYMHDR